MDEERPSSSESSQSERKIETFEDTDIGPGSRLPDKEDSYLEFGDVDQADADAKSAYIRAVRYAQDGTKLEEGKLHLDKVVRFLQNHPEVMVDNSRREKEAAETDTYEWADVDKIVGQAQDETLARMSPQDRQRKIEGMKIAEEISREIDDKQTKEQSKKEKNKNKITSPRANESLEDTMKRLQQEKLERMSPEARKKAEEKDTRIEQQAGEIRRWAQQSQEVQSEDNEIKAGAENTQSPQQELQQKPPDTVDVDELVDQMEEDLRQRLIDMNQRAYQKAKAQTREFWEKHGTKKTAAELAEEDRQLEERYRASLNQALRKLDKTKKDRQK